NLLITTTHGRQFSLLLFSRGASATSPKADFVLQYKPAASFLVEPEPVPFPLVGETTVLGQQDKTRDGTTPRSGKPLFAPAGLVSAAIANTRPVEAKDSRFASLDDLLERQKAAPLPKLFGQRIEDEPVKGDRLRTGISEVLDGGDQVTVSFSVVNTSKHAILLMPPQV